MNSSGVLHCFSPSWTSVLRKLCGLKYSRPPAVNAALKKNPDLSYEEVSGKYFQEENIGVKMNQISPKFFEFIAARTALILFEGDYSGVLVPHRHYFPLKKDYSNLDEILTKLDDLPLLKEMTGRAYDEVVASGRYSYRAFVRKIDDVLEQHVSTPVQLPDSSPLPTTPPPTRRLMRLRQLRGSSIMRIAERYLELLHEKTQNFESMIERRRAKLAKFKEKAERRTQTAGNTA